MIIDFKIVYIEETEIKLSKYAKIPNMKLTNINLKGSLSKTSINLTTDNITKELNADMIGIEKGI